jgi:hypothetical protein
MLSALVSTLAWSEYVLHYDWWMRVRLCVRDCVCGSQVAVVAELSYSKDEYRYQRVPSNSVRNIIMARKINI